MKIPNVWGEVTTDHNRAVGAAEIEAALAQTALVKQVQEALTHGRESSLLRAKDSTVDLPQGPTRTVVAGVRLRVAALIRDRD